MPNQEKAAARKIKPVKAVDLLKISKDDELLEVARLAVEEELVELRDSRIFQVRGNGLVIREKDGTNSNIIRLGMEQAMRIGLEAIHKHIHKAK